MNHVDRTILKAFGVDTATKQDETVRVVLRLGEKAAEIVEIERSTPNQRKLLM